MRDREDEYLLSCYLDGAPAGAEAARIEARLRAEPALAQRLAQLRRVDGLVKRLGGAPPIDTAAFHAALRARLAQEPAPRRRAWRMRRVAPLSAAAAVLLAFGWLIGRSMWLRSGAMKDGGAAVVSVAVMAPTYAYAREPAVVEVRVARGADDVAPTVAESSRLMIMVDRNGVLHGQRD